MSEEKPILYTPVLNDLSKLDGVNRDFLHNVILGVPRVGEVVDQLFDAISKATNDARKIDIFKLVLEYLSAHPLDESYDDDKIYDLLRNIVAFPVIIKDQSVYSKLNTVLQSVFEKLASGSKDKIVSIVQVENSLYAPFVFASFAVKNEIYLNIILNNVSTSNVPLLEGLKLLFLNHVKSELQEEDQELLNTSVINTFIQSCLGAFNDVVKSYGVSFITGLLYYDPEAAANLLPSYDSIHSLLRKSTYELRVAVLELLSSLSINQDNQEYFASAFKIACALIQNPQDELISSTVNYAQTIKQQEFFTPLLHELLGADATVIGAFLVAFNIGAVTPECLEIAFPGTASHPRLLISVSLIDSILKNEKCTDAIFCALLNQAISAYSSADILKRNDTKAEVIKTISSFINVYEKFGTSFSLTLLNRITEIRSQDILAELAKKGAELEAVKTPSVEDESLFKAVSYVFSVVIPLSQVQNIIQLFAEVSSKEAPKTPRELLSNCIPSSKLNDYITYAESSLKQIPRLAVLCVSAEGLDDSKLDELLKFIQQDDIYNLNLGVQFFTALGTYYFDYFFNLLEKESFGKQVTGNIFIARKKRLRFADTCKSLCISLPRVVADREFDESDQKRLLTVLFNLIPRTNIEDFTEQLKELRPVFKLVKDVNATEEQYTLFVESGFIREIPYFLRGVKGNPELSQQYTTIFADNLKIFHYEPENIEAVARTLFRISPSEDSLYFAMELVRKRIKPKDTALKFATYAKCFALAAAENNVHITTPRFAPFLVKFIIYTTCKATEFRELAFSAFASLFSIPNPPTEVGEGLTQEQVNEQALTLFKLIAPKLSPEIINELLQIIHKKRFYTISHGLLIRALFEVRDDLGQIDIYGVAVMRLLKIQPQMPALNRYHMEKGIMSFAKRSMSTFLPLFLSSESPYLSTLVGRILSSYEHRSLFIRELILLINKTTKLDSSLILFQSLKRIALTENTNEFSVESFSAIVAGLLMWAATIFQLEPELNLIEINNAHSDMQEVFSILTSKSSVAAKSDVNFTTTEALTLNTTVSSIARNLINVDIERLTALAKEVSLMLSSPKQSFVLVAGYFFIQFAAAYSPFSNSQTEEFISNLYASITNSFLASNLTTTRSLACSLNRALVENFLPKFVQSDITKIYNKIMESIESTDTTGFELETINCLCNISPSCNSDELHPRRLLEIIRCGFDNYEVNPAFFVGIYSYLQIKPDLNTFQPSANGKGSKLSLLGLFQILNKFQDQIIPILQKLAEDENIVQGLSGKINTEQLSQCGSIILDQYQQLSMTPVLYDLLCDIALAVNNANDETSKKYKNTFILLSLPAGENKANPLNAKAIETIKRLIH